MASVSLEGNKIVIIYGGGKSQGVTMGKSDLSALDSPTGPIIKAILEATTEVTNNKNYTQATKDKYTDEISIIDLKAAAKTIRKLYAAASEKKTAMPVPPPQKQKTITAPAAPARTGSATTLQQQASTALTVLIKTGDPGDCKKLVRTPQAEAAFLKEITDNISDSGLRNALIPAYRKEFKVFDVLHFIEFLKSVRDAVFSNTPDRLSIFTDPDKGIYSSDFVKNVSEPLVKLCRDGLAVAPETPVVPVRTPQPEQKAKAPEQKALGGAKASTTVLLSTEALGCLGPLFDLTLNGTPRENSGALITAAKARFGVSESYAPAILEAISDAYQTLNDTDTRNQFHTWMAEKAGSQSKLLVNGMKNSGDAKGVILNIFYQSRVLLH